MSRFPALSLSVAAVALGACGHAREDFYYASGAHRQIEAVEVMAELSIENDSASEKLGSEGRAAVRQFASAYRQEGAGPLVVSRPRGGAGEAAGLRLAGEIHAILLAEGVRADRITESAYDASGSGGASFQMLLSYAAWEAQVPDCPSIGSHPVTRTSTNISLPSFGCAVATNLAMMIANPADLVGRQPMDEPDALRRSVMFTKYRAGDATASARSGDAKGVISSAIGN